MEFRKTTQAKFPSSEVLSVILPTKQETRLLRACLHSGESGRRAWKIWQEQAGNLIEMIRDKSSSIRWLLPLLFAALKRNSVELDKEFLTHLRTAYMREELRTDTYRRICRHVISELSSADISTIVLKGAALADTIYSDPALRHSHDINILIENGEDMFHATILLSSLGFTVQGEEDSSGIDGISLKHKSGLPLQLHRRLFRIPFYKVSIEDIWLRSRRHTIANFPARILSPADNLLHVCGHSSYCRSRNSLRWVCDSWLLIDKYPDLDWEVFLDSAQRSHLALPLSVMLSYLSEYLDATIPENLLERLHAAASSIKTIGRDMALHGARTSTPGGFRSLVRNAGKRSVRAHLLLSWLVPSPSYLRWAYGVRSSWLLPFYYIYRPLRYSLNRIWLLGKSCLKISSFRRFRITPRINS